MLGAGRLVADMEGIAIQRQDAGAGYLLVSSQGDDAALPPPFEQGLLVVQDDRNTGPDARQDFKLVPWREVKQALGLDH